MPSYRIQQAQRAQASSLRADALKEKKTKYNESKEIKREKDTRGGERTGKKNNAGNKHPQKHYEYSSYE